MNNRKLNNTEERLKQTAKLEKMITEGADYEEILKQSQIIDRYIAKELNDYLVNH